MSSFYGHAPTGEPQRAHQTLQAEVWRAEAEILLDRIGVEPGWTCVDLGSGATGILANLSRRVGTAGCVVGVDLVLELARSARDAARSEGRTNVHPIVADLMEPALACASFDLVHARFMLHLAPAEQTIQHMTSLARPGGFVALEEPDLATWRYEPETPAWAPLLRALTSAIALRGDPNVGRRAPDLLRGAGLEEVETRSAVLCLRADHPHTRLPLAWAAAQRDAILEHGLATEAELTTWIVELERHLENPKVTMATPTPVQAWGRRPTRPA